MIKMVELYDYQQKAIKQLKNGSILCGGVGSGKSRTALAYYFLKVCYGKLNINGEGSYKKPLYPRDLFIITTAKKRDSLEWKKEAAYFLLPNKDIRLTIDSWNNIKKYKDIYGCFFIFDEQRLVGNGTWVKTFYNIARKNQWILLSATPGDKWTDYIPVFVANGFYRNKTEFNKRHCIFSRFSKYPKIERFIGVKYLDDLRNKILVPMEFKRATVRNVADISVEYDKNKYRMVFRDRWNPYDNCPIDETGKLVYLLRKVVNEDKSRLEKCKDIISFHKKVIIFYNFTYELNNLRNMCKEINILYKEWNGECHEELPEGDRWVYLVQYSAGAEGWNCITTDTIIFFSQNYSYRLTEQAAGRIDRANTPYSTLYYYFLRSSSQVDRAIKTALVNKRDFNERAFIKHKTHSL